MGHLTRNVIWLQSLKSKARFLIETNYLTEKIKRKKEGTARKLQPNIPFPVCLDLANVQSQETSQFANDLQSRTGGKDPPSLSVFRANGRRGLMIMQLIDCADEDLTVHGTQCHVPKRSLSLDVPLTGCARSSQWLPGQGIAQLEAKLPEHIDAVVVQ
jgi:hypothetical protein